MPYVDTTSDSQSSSSATTNGVTTTTTAYSRTYIRTYVDYVPAVPGLLSVSGNGRYLLDGDNSPFLLIGDSPQGIMSDCTPAQMETYMSNREDYGINFLQVHLLSGATFGGNSTTFQAQDGTHPFTSDGDISTPNESYFSQVDDMLELAASHGMVVCLDVAEFMDGAALFDANTETKCTNFGTYLGNRYKNTPNIIWNYGNDYTVGQDTDYDARVVDIYNAIKAVDTNHLHTIWLQQVASRETSQGWGSRVDIDLGYSYAVTYGQAITEYNRSPAKPYHFGEGGYEGETPNGYLITPNHIRRQAWWTFLWGGSGMVYCNADIWKFLSGWASRLDNYPGLYHLTLLTVLSNYAWYNLIPDTTHTYLTAGYGTYDVEAELNTNDYATCAYLADDSLAIIYMPSNRTMSVDMSQFSGEVVCRWLDPTNGGFTSDAASPHTNSGSHDFSRADANSAGDHDWVLVLELS